MRGGAASALDLTWDVLDADGYAELTSRQSRKFFASAAAEAPMVATASPARWPADASANDGARGGGGGDGGRTDRVVEMLASLEQAVMDVCKVHFSSL